MLDGHTIRTVERVKRKLKEKPVAVVSFGSPYLLSRFDDVDAYLCAFGFRWPSERAAAQAVVGTVEPSGKLPVTLSAEAAFGHALGYKKTAAVEPPEQPRVAQP